MIGWGGIIDDLNVVRSSTTDRMSGRKDIYLKESSFRKAFVQSEKFRLRMTKRRGCSGRRSSRQFSFFLWLKGGGEILFVDDNFVRIMNRRRCSTPKRWFVVDRRLKLRV